MPISLFCGCCVFLSTLSLRRATFSLYGVFYVCIFLSTLSLRRATQNIANGKREKDISIHALLAESDNGGPVVQLDISTFLSTLSLRRAT